MFLKRILALGLILTLCFSAAGSFVDKQWDDWNHTAPETLLPPEKDQPQGVGEDATISAVKPLLYKVTDEDGHILWLFGSIHTGREDFYPLPDYVTDAFESAEILAVEVDIIAFSQDREARTKAIRELRYPEGTNVKDYIPEELYNEAVALLTEAGNYDPGLINYMPVLWSDYVDSAASSKQSVKNAQSVDQYILNMAYQQKKEIKDIESGKFQYSMMASFSPELQQLLLEQSIAEYKAGTSQETTQHLQELWAKGDGEALSELLNMTDPVDDPQQQALYAEYKQTMFTKRNDTMTKFAQYALSHGEETFICVGAGHICGETGLARQLADLGYTVERITG